MSTIYIDPHFPRASPLSVTYIRHIISERHIVSHPFLNMYWNPNEYILSNLHFSQQGNTTIKVWLYVENSCLLLEEIPSL